MARPIDANELEMFPYSEGAGTEEQIADWIEQVGLSKDDTASRARDLCWKVIEGFINVVKTQPTLAPPNEPLSLEQLREMNGEPVWVKVFGPTDIRCDGWCEVEVRDKNTSDEIAYVWWAGSEVEDIGRTEDYGKTWIAYRRPPEGEEDT